MTLPYERYAAIKNTRSWLILNMQNTRLPRYIREEMHALLRHYPMDVELEMIAEETGLLEVEADDLAKMIRDWQEDGELGVDRDDLT